MMICTEVEASSEPIIQSKNVIYLTFDDGPSVITDKVLNILKENNIKATFFVIGNQIKDQEAVVKRIHDEGHGIGLHTYTHKFRIIYSSNEAFIKEMKTSQDEIHRITNITPTIIRFPGGSRTRLNEEMLALLHSYNFKVYDWNITVSDGINPKTSSDKLFNEATKGTVKPDPIILLMHCDYMHKNTYIALPRIIKYYQNKNYEFRVIDEDTPEYYVPYKKTSMPTSILEFFKSLK